MGQDNKRIFKNSLLLYIRMAITIIISLYTSRVLLNALGIEDFGILNVVGGIAVIFSFLSNALSTTTQRFITFEIGKGSTGRIKQVFSSCINCHLFISFIILLFAETIGLWFINSNLNIASERMLAANWVYQFGVMTMILGIINVPYTGFFIAYEKMGYFAITSIVNTVLKLVIVFFVKESSLDHLSYYASLLFLTSVLKQLMDFLYCRYKFTNCRYVFYWNYTQFKELFSFAGWNIFKNAAIIGVSQGNNIIINVFGGTIASAAMGIANQVNSQVYGFIQNVQVAFNPQITKSCSTSQMQDFYSLILNSSKFSSILLLLIAVPLLVNMDYVLYLWLGVVPDGAVSFCSLSIISVYIDSISGPLTTGILAFGKIKKFQVYSSIIWILSIPVAFLFVYLGFSLYIVIAAKILAQIVVLCFSAFLLSSYTAFPSVSFFKSIVLPQTILFLFCSFASFALSSWTRLDSLFQLFVTTLFSSIIIISIVWMIFFTREDRVIVIAVIKSKFLYTKSK